MSRRNAIAAIVLVAWATFCGDLGGYRSRRQMPRTITATAATR